MDTAPRRGTGRLRVLDAAVEIAAEAGAQAVTLDAVAARAGVSKGGLLHHFPSKEALLAAVVERLTEQYRQDVTATAAADREPAGRGARAYVLALAADGTRSARDAAFVALAAAQLELMTAWRDLVAAWLADDATDGGDPVDLTVARLAADGLWWNDLLGAYGLDDPRRRRAVVERIVALTERRADGQPRP